MKKEIEIKCPAKINLSLDVIGRRSDGYHNLSMIMQEINLFDIIKISVYETEAAPLIELFCKDKHIPTDGQNLIVKAANLFFKKTGITASTRIHLCKNIPVGAGLGGGSSDAAGTLMALNTLFESPLSGDALAVLAKSLGADVPFFLYGGCMLAEGIGEILSPLPPLKNAFIVLAKPKISISTAYVYKNLVLDSTTKHPDIKAAITALHNQDIDTLAKVAGNILETVVQKEHPEISEYKEIMLKNGASYSLMSGSGSSVFGVFKDRPSAEKALSEFKHITTDAYLV
ncbi:MAG: 4-(cytidine 5'-diphospho)-2-C-methyl-D-erythritol kinase [Clostridia bacterium]|nr:4-(cytidine 5'-diphospho)-2-C-methyl-D-erythritol kinase [Clostridia bacterium]